MGSCFDREWKQCKLASSTALTPILKYILRQLAALYSHVQAAERQQNEIDQTLDHIEQQQKDLLSTLEAYEKVSQEILGGQGGSLRSLDTGPADSERDKK